MIVKANDGSCCGCAGGGAAHVLAVGVEHAAAVHAAAVVAAYAVEHTTVEC